jgi:phytoene dehydrogenase-like protein
MRLVTFSLFVAAATAFNVAPGVGQARGKPLVHGANAPTRVGDSKLAVMRFFRPGRGQAAQQRTDEETSTSFSVPTVDDATEGAKPIPRASSIPMEDADIIVIGGGVGGLTAAISAAESAKKKGVDPKIVLLEAGSEVGGRVKSEKTDDGFILDHGFAVFIDQYPTAKKVLDFDKLKLKPFLPGALVKLKNQNRLARVADPLREPGDLLNDILAPVGSIIDKIDVVPLYVNVRLKSIDELFEERETDTETALIERWGFSDFFIATFFKPFLEGIYLAPLSKQSSRMFSFVMKMFCEGSATLPEGGMGAISAQLAEKAEACGVEIRTDIPVTRIGAGNHGEFVVESFGKKRRFQSPSVVLATDGKIARKMLSTVDGFENLVELPEQPQLSVGNLYYSFKGNAPVDDPILILNGIGEEAGSENFPVNNVCFPSEVNKGYAPEGYGLCSVTVLGGAMAAYEGRPEELDQAVRRQLGTWFREQRSEILEDWELKKIFYVSC